MYCIKRMPLVKSAEEFVDRLLNDEEAGRPYHECNSELELSLPPWYDERKFKLGKQFYFDNYYGQIGAHVMGLLTIISVPSILNVLVHTRRSSSTYTAYRRYASTLLHIIDWHSYDFKPGTRAWKSILEVRRRHRNASKNAQTTKVGNVSQRDIALTQFGFVGHLLLYPDRFGMQAFEKGSWEGFVHMWKTFTYMIGLKDKYNLCQGTVEETTEICRILMKQVFAPLLEFPPEPYEHMAYVIVDGIWSIMPLVEPRSTIYAVRMFAGVPGYVYTEQELINFRTKINSGELENPVKPVKKGWHEPGLRPKFNPEDYHRLVDVPEYKKLTVFNKFKLHTVIFLASIYPTYLGKILLNYSLRFLVYLTSEFPILAFVRWGVSKSWINIFKESIGDDTEPMTNEEVKRMLSLPPWYNKFLPFK